MMQLAITCPVCGSIHIYRFKLATNTVWQIGDFVDESNKSYFKTDLLQCIDCNKLFRICSLIEDGRLVNILINPDDEELGKIENLIFEKLLNYPLYFKPDYMKECLYGEITNIIPSQFSVNSKLDFDKELLLFGLKWRVKNGYKVFNEEGILETKIYQIMSNTFDERLLVLRKDCLPVLKDVDWNVTSYSDVETKLKKFIIPKEHELVMTLS